MTDCNEKPAPQGTPQKTLHKLPILLELDLLFIQPYLIFLQLYCFQK